jgi:hypothetical protein
VLGGVVSVDAARDDYGVVIDAGGVIDEAATKALRERSRGTVRMFHRNDYFGPPVAPPR